MLAFILEGLGTTELLVILVVALILFGPRRLPQLARSLGKSLNDFKRTSEDFKHQWEKEVTLEEREKEARIENAMLPEDNSILGNTVERNRAIHAAAATAPTQAQEEAGAAAAASSTPQTADSALPQQQADRIAPAVDAHTEAAPMGKRDWL
ncbi:MAG: twin-arginine translocase subunit TatB [Acidobacteria bacterium]|nr:twin-arginine translocase subunit TatB [Acidobacteriota bacterium]